MLKIILILFLSIFFNCFALEKTTPPIEVQFTVNYVTEDEFSAQILLKNSSNQTFNDWNLGFTLQRQIVAVTGAKIFKQIGDYYLLEGDKTSQTLPAHGSLQFSIKGQYTMRNKDDAPAGYFFTYKNSWGFRSKPMIVESKFILPMKKFFTSNDEYNLTNKNNNTALEGNPIGFMANQSSIVPAPVQYKKENGEFILKPTTTIYVNKNNKDLLELAKLLVTTFQQATGYQLTIQEVDSEQSKSNSIYLIQDTRLPELGQEGYLLNVRPNSIAITAQTVTGLFYGVQTLKQLLPPEIYHSQPLNNKIWNIPAVSIKDYPRFAYRGVLFDVARHFFTVEEVKKLLDVMAIHKLNVLHWHLSDDEGWRIEINRYPSLTHIGAWRGYYEILPPSLGSGMNRYGGYYTQNQIRDIVQYAEKNHITIIPEIDMPSHARAMIQSLPNLLIDKNDHTQYKSVRGYTDNVLSPCIPETYTVVENILSELVTLFPSHYIHIGSDERPEGAWKKSPACIALMKKEGLKNTHELQNYFSKKIQTFLATQHRAIGAWEEVMEGGILSKDPKPLIYSWLGMDREHQAIAQGYDVILTPYQYLYLEMSYVPDYREPGEYWGGYVDTFKVYSYHPTIDIAKGVEGSIWTEYIDSSNLLDYLVFPKLSALSEVAWSQPKDRNWQGFSNRLGHFHLPRLDQLGVLYRLSPPGLNRNNNNLIANIEYPGLQLRYTIDGSLPNAQSLLYEQPLTIGTGTPVKMRSFDTKGRGSWVSE